MFIDKSSLAIFSLVIMIGIFSGCGETEKKKTNTPETEQVVTPTEIPVVSDGASGKEIFATCAACHGENGQGLKALNAPSLVNQEAWYLERQLQHFKNGVRGGDPEDVTGAQMAAIAKTLKDGRAIKNVVEYIKTLPSAPTEKTLEGDIQNGRDYYNMICGACHGAGAVGNSALNSPALVGIDDWYLVKQFHNFKTGIRGSHPDDEFGAQMKQISNAVPEDDLILDAVAYIQSLQKNDMP